MGEDPFLADATSWPVGLAVSGAWAVVAWALGVVLLERRDVSRATRPSSLGRWERDLFDLAPDGRNRRKDSYWKIVG
jgi:hypothetical protein